MRPNQPNVDLDIWGSLPTGGVLCLPDLALAAEKRMWLTYLKGNYWRESLSMPLTDNQLIMVLIIYSSPPLPVLYSFSCVTEAEHTDF